MEYFSTTSKLWFPGITRDQASKQAERKIYESQGRDYTGLRIYHQSYIYESRFFDKYSTKQGSASNENQHRNETNGR